MRGTADAARTIVNTKHLRQLLIVVSFVAAVFVVSPQSAAAAAPSYDPLALLSVSNPPAPIELIAHDVAHGRDVPLRVYLPENKASPAPAILFSHGLGGSRNGSTFLGKHWAARGYVAVFLQHPGSDDSVWRGLPPEKRFEALSEAVSARNFIARVHDVRATLDELTKWNRESGHVLAGRLDLDHVGMSGHSFGAITTQAVSGESFPTAPSITDPRIKAAVIFSPSKPAAGDVAKAFGAVNLPWLLMTGTNDIARIGARTIGATDVTARLAVFPALPPGDKYELVLDGADHMVFTDRDEFFGERARNPNHHRIILALSTAFWDTFLRADADAKNWLNGDAPRKLMDEKDRWQKK